MMHTRSFSLVALAVLLLAPMVARAAEADLQLNAYFPAVAPTAGTPSYVIFSVMNMGGDTATGVRVKVTLPPDLTRFPLPDELPYDDATDEWIVGTVAPFEDAKFKVGFRAALETPFTISGEISASDATDPNSTPDNGVDGEDDQTSLNGEVMGATTQPDLTVKLSGDAHAVGLAVYEDMADTQVRRAELSSGPTAVTWLLTLTNQSTMQDTILFSGPETVGDWTLVYTLADGPQVGEVIAPTGYQCTLDGDGAITIQVVATPPTGSREKDLAFECSALSTMDMSRSDAVRCEISIAAYVDMDMTITGPGPVGPVGEGIYNETGDEQTVSAQATGTQTVTYTATITNTGVVADTYLVTGPAGANGWSVQYLSGSTPITTPVTGTGYTTPAVNPGASIAITIRVAATAQTRGSQQDVLLSVRSVLDGSYRDAVLAQTTRPVVTKVDVYQVGANFAYVGRNTINTTGENQSYALTTAQGQAAIYTVIVSNPGNCADDVRVTAPAPPAGWTVVIKNGPTDVSNAVFGAGYTLMNIAAGGWVGLTVEVTPVTAYGEDVLTQLLTGASLTDGGAIDTIRMVTTVQAVRTIDASLRAGTAGPFTGLGTYAAAGAGQTLTGNTTPGATHTYQVQVKNEGNLPQAMVVKVPSAAGWTITVVSLADNANITTAATSSSGWTSPDVDPAATLMVAVTIAPTAALEGGSTLSELITITPAGGQGPTEGVGIGLTLATVRGIDATVRNEGLPTKLGEGFTNTTGDGQTAAGIAGRGIPVSFVVEIKNTGNVDDTFRIAGNGTGSNWIHTYRDMATNADITALITASGGMAVSIPRGGAMTIRLSLTPDAYVAINTVRTATVVARNAANTTLSDTVKASATRAVVRQADMMVRTLSEPAYTGDNIYEPTGDAQRKALDTPRGKAAVYRVLVQNDSDTTESIRLTGTGGAPGWKVRYFDSPTGGYEITHLITGSTGWVLANRSSRAIREIRVEVTPDSTAAFAAPYAVTVSAIVLANPEAVDTVKLETTRVALPLTGVTLTTSAASVAVGMPVTLSAAAEGGDNVTYRFAVRYKDPVTGGQVWMPNYVRAYSPLETVTWSFSEPREYTLVVYACEKGATGTDKYAITDKRVLTVTP